MRLRQRREDATAQALASNGLACHRLIHLPSNGAHTVDDLRRAVAVHALVPSANGNQRKWRLNAADGGAYGTGRPSFNLGLPRPVTSVMSARTPVSHKMITIQ
jgi:hypothetical protein